uniref:Integrase catalytic region n=1 Tax=Cyanothece sp. (strain PCC 7425 / ATCC 29141) TaxID=395961 RepID=B8HXC0_CYAP4
MLDEKSFDNWCQSVGLSQAAREVVERVRSSSPSRRVQSGRGNVSGNYPSRKMGVTIQFESHRNELARIYELEHDPGVLEYYDQPPKIELDYLSKNGRRVRTQYTPDFFVIRNDSAGWEECKTEDDLKQLAEDSPNRYQRAEDNRWRCPPAEAYALPLELYFQVRSSAEINWIFQQNFVWLEDYLGTESLTMDESVADAIIATVRANEGITLLELIQQLQGTDADAIYILIATEQIYVDLMAERLANSDRARVFSSPEIAQAFQLITLVEAPLANSSLHIVQVGVGTTIHWDGEVWEIVNTGSTMTGLLRSDGKFIELPNSAIDELIQKGKIQSISAQQAPDSKAEVEEMLRCARPADIKEANRRYEIIQPYLEKDAPACPTRTIRRWRNQYWQAEKLYGNGYVGLLPNHQKKGNYLVKVNEVTQAFMLEFIEKHYENLKQRSKLRVYQAFVEACESHEPKLNPPSRTTFTLAIQKRAGHQQTLKREGRRAAIQKEEFYWELELTTPRHGDRPFEIVHIDHTQLDIELISSLNSLAQCNPTSVDATYNLGRPWATFMVDAYSRRLLAVYITYEEPSYRSCMMVLRICVQRFKRFPQTIVVDNGAEFHSHYFEQLLATYQCTKKHRPPAKARFGAVVERLFGTANKQLIHELQGNTQITRKHRQVTQSVHPQKLALWTLGDLYESLCEWAYKVYADRQHPALGQSPNAAFAQGLALGGSRIHRRVEYDQVFRILTLPAPERGQRKVQPGQGIKLSNIYYWSNAFRDPEIEQSMVEVRYDPFDASIAYALVRKQWVRCISSYYQQFQNRSEKEIRLITAELIKQKRDQGRDTNVTDKELAQFLSSTEMKEGKFLEQRLRTTENRVVIQNSTATEDDPPITNSQNSYEPSLMLPSEDELDDQEDWLNTGKAEAELEFYGEY